MSQINCPNCGAKTLIFDDGGAGCFGCSWKGEVKDIGDVSEITNHPLPPVDREMVKRSRKAIRQLNEPLFLDKINDHAWVDADKDGLVITKQGPMWEDIEMALNPEEAEKLLDILRSREDIIRKLAKEWKK
jgi:hypothetical protein